MDPDGTDPLSGIRDLASRVMRSCGEKAVFLAVYRLAAHLGGLGAASRGRMGGSSDTWDGEVVRKWLDRRVDAARLEQAAADKRGYESRDDYDKAAAEEWVCRALRLGHRADDRAAFAALLKELLARDEYPITGIHDDRRVDRHVRAHLKKVARMTKANEGFANTLRYQD